MSIFYLSLENQEILQLFTNGYIYKYFINHQGTINGQFVIQALKQKIVSVFFNGERSLNNYLFTNQYIQSIQKYQSEQLTDAGFIKNVNMSNLWGQLENTFYFPMRNTRPLRACQGRQNVITAFSQYITAKQFYAMTNMVRCVQNAKNTRVSVCHEQLQQQLNDKSFEHIDINKQKQFQILDFEFPDLIQPNTTDYFFYHQFRQVNAQKQQNQNQYENKIVKDQYKQVIQYPSSYTLCGQYPLILNSGEVIFGQHCFGTSNGAQIHLDPDGSVWHITENSSEGYTIQSKDMITYSVPQHNTQFKYFQNGKIELSGSINYTYDNNMFDFKQLTNESLIPTLNNYLEIVYFKDSPYDISINKSNTQSDRMLNWDASTDFESDNDCPDDINKQYNSNGQKDKQLYHTKQLSVSQLQTMKKDVSIVIVPVLEQKQLYNTKDRIDKAKQKLHNLLSPQNSFINNFANVQYKFKPLKSFCTLCLNYLPNKHIVNQNINIPQIQKAFSKNIILQSISQPQSYNLYELNQEESKQNNPDGKSFRNILTEQLIKSDGLLKYDILFSHVRNKTSLLFQSEKQSPIKQLLFCLRGNLYSKGIIIQYVPRKQREQLKITQVINKLKDQGCDNQRLYDILNHIELLYNDMEQIQHCQGIQLKNLCDGLDLFQFNIDMQDNPIVNLQGKTFIELVEYFTYLLEFRDEILINYGIFDNAYIDALKCTQVQIYNAQNQVQNTSSQEEKIPQFYGTNAEVQNLSTFYYNKKTSTSIQTNLIFLRNNIMQISCFNQNTMGKNAMYFSNDTILLLNIDQNDEITSPVCVLSTLNSVKQKHEFQENLKKYYVNIEAIMQEFGLFNKQHIYGTVTCNTQQYAHYFQVTKDHLLFSFVHIDDWLSSQKLYSNSIDSYVFEIAQNQTKIVLVINSQLQESLTQTPSRLLTKFNQIVLKILILRVKICFQNICGSNDIFYNLEKFFNIENDLLQSKQSSLQEVTQALKQQDSANQEASTSQKVDIETFFISQPFNQLFKFLLKIFAEIDVDNLIKHLSFQAYVNEKQCLSYEIFYQLDHFLTRMLYLGIQ